MAAAATAGNSPWRKATSAFSTMVWVKASRMAPAQTSANKTPKGSHFTRNASLSSGSGAPSV